MLPAFWVASSPTLTAIPSPVETVSSICLAPVTAATIPVRPDACWSPGAGSTAPLARDAVLHVAETLSLRVDDALRGDRRSPTARHLGRGRSVRGRPGGANRGGQRPDAEILALWLADAVLAALR